MSEPRTQWFSRVLDPPARNGHHSVYEPDAPQEPHERRQTLDTIRLHLELGHFLDHVTGGLPVFDALGGLQVPHTAAFGAFLMSMPARPADAPEQVPPKPFSIREALELQQQGLTIARLADLLCLLPLLNDHFPAQQPILIWTSLHDGPLHDEKNPCFCFSRHGFLADVPGNRAWRVERMTSDVYETPVTIPLAVLALTYRHRFLP